MKKQVLVAILGSALALPLAAQAEGGYVGVNVGSAKTKESFDGISRSEKNTGYKLYGGFDFTKNFGAEIGYVDFGKVSDPIGSYKTRAFYAAATGTLPLNEQFSLLAKVGVTANRLKWNENGGDSGTEKNTNAMFGVGAAYNFTKNLSVVAEYENFGKAVDEADGNVKVDLFSVGLRYKF
jgi:OOP family OmpA-OmpF porin